MPTFKCSAILFDLDGVLMDSTPSVARQWSLWARENNIDPKKVELVHGRPTIEGVGLVAPHLDVEVAELDSVCKPGTILATNTSTLPVVEIAMATGASRAGVREPVLQPGARPWRWSRWCGRSRPATPPLQAAVAFAEKCGKDPVEVKDQAGFIVNAPALPLPQQHGAPARGGRRDPRGHRRRHEGRMRVPDGAVSPSSTSSASTHHLAILDALYEEYRDPNYAAVPLLRRLVTSGQLGRKTKTGLLRLQPLINANKIKTRKTGTMVGALHPSLEVKLMADG